MDPGSLERGGLQLLRQLERARGRLAREVLRVRRRRVAQEQRPAQLVVEPLVRLDDVAVEGRRDTIPGALAELDELAVLHDRDGLTGELSGGHALHRARETVEVSEQRAESARERIEGIRVEAQ